VGCWGDWQYSWRGFQFTDYDVALVNPEALALTVADMLSSGATQARAVLRQFQPRFTKDNLSMLRARAGPAN
jgi:hypothetical protein